MADTASRSATTVYVGGLDTALVTAATLSGAFIPFGEIVDISLPKPEAPSSTDLHRGFGYVEFEEAGDAKEAIDNMDQSELFGRVIKVAAAKPEKKDESGGLGSKTAIWESVCDLLFLVGDFSIHSDELTNVTGGIFGRVCCQRRRQTCSATGKTGCEQSAG